MFATRTDQENLAYSHQQAAAAKPLNQTKTPANKQLKTPFRGGKQDENKVFLNGKAGGGKAKENIFTTVKKGGNGANKDAFITPAGPRTRAPLGMKTTNAKATAFQTPAPPTNGKNSVKGTQKPASPRLRRAKVKIHQAEAIAIDSLEEPEIEYMPPRSTPLPDYPDDLHKIDFATVFNRETMIQDIFAEHADPVDDQGVRRSERRFQEMMERADRDNDRQLRAALANDSHFGEMIQFDGACDSQAVIESKLMKGPSTLASKNAAAALSTPGQPRFAAPTASTKARVPQSVIGSRKPGVPLSNKSTNHAVATAASRSTLGYSKGRAFSASARKPLSQAHQAEVVKIPAASQRPKEQKKGLDYLLAEDPELEEMLRRGFTEPELGESSADELDAALGQLAMDDDDALEDFELASPESE